ncbi:MAG TPA: hypothetical protein VJT09_06470, partial [Pyrinomonadaceae bacterium]|nr:hypothetical protein [Pyrinomonadaceae bacterium]
EFSDGFSETRVVLGENRSGPNDLQPFRLVFKIGAADDLRNEVNRYLDFVAYARASAAFVPIWKPELTLKALPPGGIQAAIAYANAGDVFGARDCVSFKSAFQECIRGARPEVEVSGIIESLARVIGSLYSDPAHCFANEIALYYLEHWAADYQLVADYLAETSGYPLLTLQRLNPGYFPNVKISDGASLRQESESPGNGNPLDIVLPRCTVAKFERGQLVAWLNSPEDLALQVDTRELAPASSPQLAEGSTISLWAPKKASRYDFYLRHVRLGLPSLDAEASTFEAGSLSLHNPLKHFSAPLLAAAKPPSSTLLVPGHGDLHPGNVLVAGTSPAIIDYGKSVTRIPVGADAARFFGGLVRDVLAEELSFEDLATVLANALGVGSFSGDADSPAARASRLLKLIVEKMIPANVPGLETLWPVHLYGYAWIGLKWPHSSPKAYRACFLLAGVALQCLLGQAPKEEKSPSALPGSDSEEKPAQLITAARPIKPEGPAEILILVSRFDGNGDYDPTVRIYSTLADNIFEILPGLARVERVEDMISSRKDAIEIARRYRASMIVWGTFDNMGVSPHYEVTRDSLVIKRSMLQLDQATRHKLSERFEPYITQNLAAEVSFLSFKAIAEMCVLNLNLDAALKVYNRALSLISDNERARELGAADMYQSIAAIYVGLKRNEEAIEANKMALEIGPGDLVTELQGLQIRALIEKKSDVQQIAEVKRLLRARLEANTDEPEVIEVLREILAKFEPLRTSADFRKLLESELPKAPPPPQLKMMNKQFEKDVAVHLQRADELFVADKYSQSLSEIRSALRLNPRCTEAFTLRAEVLAVMDRVEEALKELEKAEKLNPKYYDIYRIRACILCQSKQDYQGAIQQFDKAFELGADKQMALLAWGKTMVELDRGEEAMQLMRDWNLDPSDPNLFIFRSQYYRKKGEYEAALQEADQAIQLLDDTSSFGLLERAEVYEEMGRREHAIQDLERAMEYTDEGAFSMHEKQRRLDELRSLLATTEAEAGEVAMGTDSRIDVEG